MNFMFPSSYKIFSKYLCRYRANQELGVQQPPDQARFRNNSSTIDHAHDYINTSESLETLCS